MTDIGELQIQVNTKPMDTATQRLTAFVTACNDLNNAINQMNLLLGKTSTGFRDLSGAIGVTKTSLAGIGQSLGAGNRALDKMGQSFETISKHGQGAAQAIEAVRAASAGMAAPAGKGAPGGGGIFGTGAMGMLSLGQGGLSASMFLRVNPAISAVTIGLGALMDVAKSAGGVLLDMGVASVKAAMELDKLNSVLLAVTGSQAGVERNTRFLIKVTDELALPLATAVKEYGKFYAAAKGTLTEAETQRVFTNMSVAIRVMNLAGSDATGVFKALTDMLSKGKISMEELRRQLGNRMPGAFQTAADSMGLTTKQLDKMVSTGQLTVDKFLVPFSEALASKFKPGLEAANQTLGAFLIRLENQKLLLGMNIGENLGIKAGTKEAVMGFYDALKSVNEALETLSKSSAGKDLAAAFQTLGFAVGELARDFAAFFGSLAKNENDVKGFAAWILILGTMVRNLGESAKFTANTIGALRKLAAGDLNALTDVAKAYASYTKMEDNFEATMAKYVEFRKKLDEVGKEDPNAGTGRGTGKSKEEEELSKVEKRWAEIIRKATEYKNIQNSWANPDMGQRFPETVKLLKQFTDSGAMTMDSDGKLWSNMSTGMTNAANAALELAFARDKATEAVKAQIEAEKQMDAEIEAAWKRQEALGDRLFKKTGNGMEEYLKALQDLDAYVANPAHPEAWKHYAEAVAQLRKEFLGLGGKDGVTPLVDLQKMAQVNKSWGRKGEIAAQYEEEIMWIEKTAAYFQWSEQEKARALGETRIKFSENWKAVLRTFEDVMGKMADAMTDMVMGAEVNWREMVTGIIKQIIRLIIELTIVTPIINAFKAAIGGSGYPGGSTPLAASTGAAYSGKLRANAGGGSILRGQASIVGEAGPELFVPNANGRIVANGDLSRGGSAPAIGSLQVVINPGEGTSRISGDQGNALARGAAAALDEYMVRQMLPGGLLDKWKRGGN